ncbi:hypothetical protein D4R78_01740 [bacterium]|nr:MAG: hypothetical protein D4R78_01740 [bacterium]
MNTQQPPVEDEIDLRDYINVIIKRKKIILTIFFVSVLTTAIISFLQPKTYKASVYIMVLPSQIQTALFPAEVSFGVGKLDTAGESYQKKPLMSLLTHKILLKSDVVSKRIIDALGLTDKSGKALTPEDLKNNLKIDGTKKDEESNVIELVVESTDPKKATDIVNAWSQEYIKYNQELISGEVKGSGDFINNQFEIAKRNLFKIEEEVRDFKNKNRIDLMRGDLNIKKGRLSEFKKELIDLGSILRLKEVTLVQNKVEIQKQDEFIIVSKAITDDALWQKSINKEKDASDFNKKKLKSEVINPIYQNLKSKIVDLEIEINTIKPRVAYLKNEIGPLEEEVNRLEEYVNQKEFELIQLNRQTEIFAKTYANLSSRIEDARIINQAQLGEVRIVSPAFEPKIPKKLNKRQNVAISGLVSLIFGTFMAFFAEYWEKSKCQK